MRHSIRDQDWIDYLDGMATTQVRDHIEAHITSCRSCWQFCQQMLEVTESLHVAGEDARHQLTLRDQQLHRLLPRVFARLQEGQEAVARSEVEGRLDRLETLLAPFCGMQAAVSALQTAARHSPARSLDQVTRANWGPFLERLTDIAAALCGETFAALVRERGQQLTTHHS